MGRATILRNEKLDFEIETILHERKFSVSNEVVSQAMAPGVSLEIGGKVRVTFDADTGTVKRVGTAEHCQGGELAHMFADLVRGSNVAGALGLVSDARRLSVLIPRQTVGLWVRCMDVLAHPYTLQCGHDFCYSCLHQRFTTFKSCPECRTESLQGPHPAYRVRSSFSLISVSTSIFAHNLL